MVCPPLSISSQNKNVIAAEFARVKPIDFQSDMLPFGIVGIDSALRSLTRSLVNLGRAKSSNGSSQTMN